MIESETRRLIAMLEAQLLAEKNDKKAVNMANYLKGHFQCYGIKAPVRNGIQAAWFKELDKQEIDHWDIICTLWEKDQREFQYIAIDYLNRIPKKKIHCDDYKILEELITSKSWWDSVDSIASNYLGKYFRKFPEQKKTVIERWRNSENLWLNRSCLIFQLKYKNDVDFELLKSLIVQYQNEKEFFIQKAIGWSLRQYSKFNPSAVREFIDEIDLKGLARREAAKYL